MRNAWLVGVAVCAVACSRHSGGGGGGGGGGVDAANTVTPIAIKDLRMNPPASGTPIAFQNVVVTGVVASSKYGHVYVQDQGGGQYGGIQLFCNYGGKTPDCALTEAQVKALTVGTVVNVTGKYDPFKPSTPANAPTELEIGSVNITTTGQMATVVPLTVTADMLSKDAFMSSSAVPLFGELVHLTGGPYTVSNVMPTEFAATCTSMAGMMGNTFYGFEATSGSTTIAVGIDFYDTLSACLPQCGYPCTNEVTMGETYSTLTGIVEPASNQNGAVYLKISPVDDTQLAK